MEEQKKTKKFFEKTNNNNWQFTQLRIKEKKVEQIVDAHCTTTVDNS